MTEQQKSELTAILRLESDKHFDKYLKKKMKDPLKISRSWVYSGLSIEERVYGALGRSRDSSFGILWGNLVFRIAEYYNTNVYSKLKDIKLKHNGKEWIVDIAFERDGITYLIELKLGGEVDNKKAVVESDELKKRKEALIIHSNKNENDVQTYIGVIAPNDGLSAPVWNMGRLSLGFDREEVLVESELFDLISNDTDVLDFLKSEIQPYIIEQWNTVRNKILSKYL
jgi:hypothetical protein